MKNIKKILALLVALMMVLASVSAFASGDPEYKITVTPSGSGVTIDGKTFYAFKLFDATYSATEQDAVAYSIKTDNYFYTTSATKAILDQYFTFTATNDPTVMTVTVKEGVTFGESQAYALTEELNGKLPATSAADGSAVAASDKAEISLSEPGYYVVTGEGVPVDGNATDKVIAATAVTTAKPTATIKAKIDAPSIDKTVDTPKDTDEHENTKAIGDTINYTIDTNVPDMTGYDSKYFFVVTDHLTGGLTYKPDSLDVKLDGAAPAKGYSVYYSKDGTTYGDVGVMPEGYKAGDDLYIKIVFKDFIQYKNGKYISTPAVKDGDGKVTTPAVYADGLNKEGKAIQIKYDAVLNDEAKLDTGNKNTVKLLYSNNPNDEGEGDSDNGKPDEPGDGDVTGVTPEHETNTYVTGIELLKVEKGNESKKLQGVEFVVTADALNDIKETTYERFVKIGTGDDENPADYTWYLLNDGSYTDQAPVTSGEGKNDDKYADTTPNYKKVTETAIEKAAGQAVSYKVTTDANGKITLTGLKEGTYTIKEIKTNAGYNLLENPINVVVSAKTKTESGKTVFDTWQFKKDSDAESTTVNADYRFEIKVENAKGAELPSTGGIGTTIFTVGGSLLALAAAILLVTKRRMNNND